MSEQYIITKIIAYYRLSKRKKGKNKSETIRDAYGLEDQRRDVARFAAERNAKIIAEFTEVESGTKKNPHRAELDKAINMAQMHKATIVIGKQDRLARNAFLIFGLMDAGVHFVPVDRPNQSTLETQLRAVIDEEEARRISERTKAGLAVARSKGTLLGSHYPGHWEGREHRRGFKQATVASSKARHDRCVRSYGFLIDTIRKLLGEDKSYPQIAEHLNEMGQLTTAGKPFHAMAVCRILKMFEKVPA
jgi:DNA invertase Pin-like site-specific DNA recombinase